LVRKNFDSILVSHIADWQSIEHEIWAFPSFHGEEITARAVATRARDIRERMALRAGAQRAGCRGLTGIEDPEVGCGEFSP
jgi:hypothetical protein